MAAQLLREAGFKVDVQATDWGTVVSRRTSQKPVKEGGWNMFFTNWVAADVINPVANVSIGGRGDQGRLVRLGRGRQDGSAARRLRARFLDPKQKEDRRPHRGASMTR